jgi:hypothetical protein
MEVGQFCFHVSFPSQNVNIICRAAPLQIDSDLPINKNEVDNNEGI